MREDQFVEKVAGRAAVGFEAAESLTAAVLRVLSQRISGGEAADLASQLPAGLKPHLLGAGEPAQAFDADDFVRRVADRTGTDPDRARAAVRAVFTTLRETATLGELDEVTSQLPKDFRDLVGAPH